MSAADVQRATATPAPSDPKQQHDGDADADEQFDHIKFHITTTPPQPRRSLKQQNGHSNNNTADKDNAANNKQKNSSRAQTAEFDKQKEVNNRTATADKEDKQAGKEASGSNQQHSQPQQPLANGTASHEDKAHSLHPTLRFVPLDREHPPREIVRTNTPDTSPVPTRSSSPAPTNSPSSSPQHSPATQQRRLTQRKGAQKSGSHDDADVSAEGKGVSKLRLLAPPPINSSNGRQRRNSTGSPSPTPSPSPPGTPYESPSHHSRKHETVRMVNSLIPVHDIMAKLHPQQLAQHPYVLYPSLLVLLSVVGLVVLGAPLTTPFTMSWSALVWLVSNPLLTSIAVLCLLSVLGVLYRRQVAAFYKTVFLPPAGEKLPKPFSYETIELSEARWQKLIPKWSEQIDKYGSVMEPMSSESSPTAKSPQNEEHKHDVGGSINYDVISGRVALGLMEAYQTGKVNDCSFTCIRAYLTDASMNKEGDGDDTVGLAFISTRMHYDLSPYLLRLFTPIQSMFPFLCAPVLVSQSIRRWMSFRFAVVGFHWPFRSCVVFTKPLSAFNSYLDLDNHDLSELTTATDKDMRTHVARYTSLLQLVRNWDDSLPKGERSDFMLFPVMTSSAVVDSIAAVGGATLPILPTYVCDLRKFRGGDYQDYKRHLRKIGKRVREGPFEDAQGNTMLVEGSKVNEVLASGLVSLWWQVANYRGTKDQTVCLMEPNAKFVQTLAHHPAHFIHYMALRLKETTVAASLLFLLSPQLLTSDVAGFNYPALEAAGREANQQIKVYPVKLANVIKYAIQHGFEWVDFGPTTGSSKMELGCMEVALSGGLWWHGTVTSVLVKCVALCLTRQHSVAKKAYEG